MKEFLTQAFGSGNMHHAYVLEGQSAAVLPVLHELFIEHSLPTNGHADYFFQTYQSFSIEDARILKQHASSKASGGGKHIFVLDVGVFTRESEHALLKLFEEPGVGVHFFLRVNDSSLLLPTLLSRVIVVSSNETENKNHTKEAIAFLKLEYKDRLAYVTKLIAKYDKEESTHVLKDAARTLIHSLMNAVRKEVNYKTDPKYTFYLEELAKADTYLSQQGSSVKILLEHVSLILPVI